MKNKNLISSLITVGLVAFSPSSFATGIPVFDAANLNMLQQLGSAIAGVKGAVGSVRETQEAAMKQARMEQQDADQRSAMRDGKLTSMNRDYSTYPTVQQCAELTAKTGKSAAGQAARAGGSGTSKEVDARREAVASPTIAYTKILEDRKNIKTCEEGDQVASCSGKGTYHGGEYKAVAMDQNMKENNKIKVSAPKVTWNNGNPTVAVVANQPAQLTNYSITAEQQKVSAKYIGNVVMPLPPVNAAPEVMKKNPTYKALYDALLAKYDMAKTALTNIASLKYEMSSTAASNFSSYWEQSKYNEVFPDLEFPSQPSMYEILNFAATKDFYDSAQDKIGDGEDAQKYTMKQLALSNYLQLKLLDASHDNNKLLAALLSNQLQPITNESIERERVKTK